MAKSVPHSDPKKAKVNGIEIVYDTFGNPSSSPMLLIMGLGGQMIDWDEEFCIDLADRGYWVIRFDNRDIGLSTRLDEAGIPNIPALMQGEAVPVPYKLRDMADDAIGLLDALNIESAHVVGISMGGMIAQEMAIHHPARVRTMTSIMSTTGHPDLPPPKPEAAAILVTIPPLDREGYLENALQTWRVLNGPKFPIDEDHIMERAGRSYDRGLSPTGTARQYAAILASGSRREALHSVTIPTLVIHGDEDPLIPVECGKDTANSIPSAKLMIIDGMGHDIPVAVAPRIIEAIARHAV